MKPGDAAPPRSVGPVTRTDFVRFAGAGGDFNPLHHDPDAARAAGFDDVIAMGQFQAGALAGLLSDWVGVENVLEYEVRYLRPVRLGDVIELTAVVETVDDGIATIALAATVGDPVITATATVRT